MTGECVRGCTVFRRHAAKTCPVPDRSAGVWASAGLDEIQRDQLMSGDRALLRGDTERSGIWIGRYGGLEMWRECPGCQPRPAMEGGRVCEHCHDKLTEWLSSLGWLYTWLDRNVLPGNAAGAKQDWQRPASPDGQPAPLRIGVLDARVLLTDRVMELEDCARDVFGRPARRVQFSLHGATRFLLAWMPRIEADEDLVLHMLELLEDLFRQARQLVPWEDRPRRISGIFCPHCERTTLEVKPGHEDVTCRTCNATIPKERYEIWTRILADEAQRAAS